MVMILDSLLHSDPDRLELDMRKEVLPHNSLHVDLNIFEQLEGNDTARGC